MYDAMAAVVVQVHLQLLPEYEASDAPPLMLTRSHLVCLRTIEHQTQSTNQDRTKSSHINQY